MDTRVDPLQFFGSRPGEIHTIENAGGLVTGDVIRSLLVSQRYLGTRKVAIVMHTDCGLLGLDDQAEASAIGAEFGLTLPFDLGGFADLHDRLAESVRAARTTPLLLHREAVRGYIYDVSTLHLTEIPIV
jgi:carbonic anhydrase